MKPLCSISCNSFQSMSKYMSCHSVISERHLFAWVCHACGFVSPNNQYHLLPDQKNPPTSVVLPHDFAYVTAVITITNKPHITNNRSILIQLFQQKTRAQQHCIIANFVLSSFQKDITTPHPTKGIIYRYFKEFAKSKHFCIHSLLLQ